MLWIDRHPMRFDNDYGNKEFLGLINIFDLRMFVGAFFLPKIGLLLGEGLVKAGLMQYVFQRDFKLNIINIMILDSLII